MLLSPSDDQRAIVDAVADMLAAEAPFDRWFLPQTDPVADEARLLRFGAAMGWMGFTAPASIGGAEADLVDEVLIFREIGARLGPVGLVAGTIAVHLALALGDGKRAASIVSGETIVGLVVDRAGSLVAGGAAATLALVVNGAELALSAVSAHAAHRVAMDGMSSIAQIPVATPDLVIRDDVLGLRFQLLVAAVQQGLAETALAESNAYAKQREQFGKPIGSFQAVRHRIADMEMRARRAEALLYFAAVALRDGRPDAALQVHAALTLAHAAARHNAEVNIANHGAIGVTMENIGHLLLKRALFWQFATGPEDALLDALADCPPPQV
ncbi:MAG: acyl-CoA dehydrogenase [Bradyrhizobium sp.]|nr:acyl-CoA dehydrogenase [Bradyrhizobium sp.]